MFKLPTTADNFPATGKINPSSPKYSLYPLPFCPQPTSFYTRTHASHLLAFRPTRFFDLQRISRCSAGNYGDRAEGSTSGPIGQGTSAPVGH